MESDGNQGVPNSGMPKAGGAPEIHANSLGMVDGSGLSTDKKPARKIAKWILIGVPIVFVMLYLLLPIIVGQLVKNAEKDYAATKARCGRDPISAHEDFYGQPRFDIGDHFPIGDAEYFCTWSEAEAAGWDVSKAKFEVTPEQLRQYSEPTGRRR